MIPKVIHYCWFGPGQRNAQIQRCMESWHRLLPGYRIQEWNESNTPMDGPFMRAAYAQRMWSKVSNFARLHALYQQGGVYLDTDIEVIKPLDDLLHDNGFAGFELTRKHWVNNAVLGAVAGHPFVKACQDYMVSEFAATGTYLSGPGTLTPVLRTMGLAQGRTQSLAGIRVYHNAVFYPYPWWAEYHPIRVRPETYTIHHWQRSSYDMRRFPTVLKLRARLYALQSSLLALAGSRGQHLPLPHQVIEP